MKLNDAMKNACKKVGIETAFGMEFVSLPADSDEDVCQYKFPGTGRLILDTCHGQVIIDIRHNDVNAYTFRGNKRVDFLLIEPKTGRAT